MSKYDVLVLGAGPGGYIAALKAAKMGSKVVLIEKNYVGGVCLNSGCIPTKALIASANRIDSLKDISGFGIDISDDFHLNYETIQERKENIVLKLRTGITSLLKAHNIEFVKGLAKFKADKNIYIGDTKYESKNIIIATGSEWCVLPKFEPDHEMILSSDDILNLKTIPTSLCILGGGVIGCEFASIFAALGTEVTIIEAMPNLISMEDPITSKFLERSFKKKGIKLFTNSKAINLEKSSKGIQISLDTGKSVFAEKLLVAIGRKPVIEGLGFEEIGLNIKNGAVETNNFMKTNLDNVYAIGDINGKCMLAHTASEEGVIAVKNIFGENDAEMNYKAIPRPIFTNPEVSCIGATEKMLVKEDIPYNIGRSNYMAIPKAICDGNTEGQLILYSEKETNIILGAQMIGKNATELTSELTLAIRNKMTIEDIEHIIYAHPTLSEIIKETAEDCIKAAMHKVYK